MGLFIFLKTILIYGLEMLAIVRAAAYPDLDMGGQCITFHIDNNNALAALIKAEANTVFISALCIIFWAICSRMGITPWLERAPADFNIADLPTRFEKLPSRRKSTRGFPYLKELRRAVTGGLAENSSGFFDPCLLGGRFY